MYEGNLSLVENQPFTFPLLFFHRGKQGLFSTGEKGKWKIFFMVHHLLKATGAADAGQMIQPSPISDSGLPICTNICVLLYIHVVKISLCYFAKRL